MKTINPLEEVYVNLDTMRGLNLINDPDVVEALNIEAGPDFSITIEDGEASVFGNTVDESEYEDIGLHFTTKRGLGYYASYS